MSESTYHDTIRSTASGRRPDPARRVSRGGTYVYTYKEYGDDDQTSEVSFENRAPMKNQTARDEIDKRSRRISLGGLRVGATVRPWKDVSAINFVPSTFFEVVNQAWSRRRSRSIAQGAGMEAAALAAAVRARSSGTSLSSVTPSSNALMTTYATLQGTLDDAPEFDFTHFEKLKNAKHLLKDSQLWGCFYVYPELYDDDVSPVVRIREVEDVAPLVDGLLTRDMVTACLRYLKRTPLLGAYVYIKLDISHKYISNIDVLQHYKYLVYLDMNSNLLTSLDVLTYLPYLQFLSVAYNRLNSVLEYENPQWFLTDVIYKFNSVKSIGDLTKFWSLSSLDLSHNNIAQISGLENLHYLRRLDLSFNHIQRLENLNHLRITWLDLSYNNITSFEHSENTGLWTLLHLEYLNINENGLSSLMMFSGCNRLRELHARNNNFDKLLEIAIYMKQLRRLITLDLRANSVCLVPGYKEVVIRTFPAILSLDEFEIDPVEQRLIRISMEPKVFSLALHRLLRLLYVEQLSRARLSHTVPPADTTEVPLVVLVGDYAVGKGTLMRRLAQECSSMVEPAILHTTAGFHGIDHYIHVSRDRFDQMILDGEFLTYSEMYGHSYGLSRDQAWVTNRVKICTMDLAGAMMLTLRGRRPFLIFTYIQDKEDLKKRQQDRMQRVLSAAEEVEKKSYMGAMADKTTLQVMISCRILVSGILNEIMSKLPDIPVSNDSAFIVESECSLFLDSETRQAAQTYNKALKLSNILDNLRTSSSEPVADTNVHLESLDSVFYRREAEAASTDVFDYGRQLRAAAADRMQQKTLPKNSHGTFESRSQRLLSMSSSNIESTQSSFRGSKKSVSFNGASADPLLQTPFRGVQPANSLPDAAGKCPCWEDVDDELTLQPKSEIMKPSSAQPLVQPKASSESLTSKDHELWIAFLADIGCIGNKTKSLEGSIDEAQTAEVLLDTIYEYLGAYRMVPTDTKTRSYQDYCEEVHALYPGWFWDTVPMDNPDTAFRKMKNILRDTVECQKKFETMFDINFVDLTKDYPHIEKRLNSIYKEIAPHKLFY